MNVDLEQGYGTAFNERIVQGNRFWKRAKNDHGCKKLEQEIQWYTFCFAKTMPISIPRIYSMEAPRCIEMEFYKNYSPLYEVYWNSTPDVRQYIVKQVSRSLDALHNVETKTVSKEIIERDLQCETVEKIQLRFHDIKECIDSTPIVSVEKIPLLSMEQLLAYIGKKIKMFQQDLPLTYYFLHGDCQFSNVLYNKETQDLLFVDPRGYFGNTKLFGLPQYDSAKLLFALTGYDVFDKMIVESLDIQNGDLTLPAIPMEKGVLSSITFEVILMLTIWLANAHCFRSNPAKTVLSHSYARYLGTLVYMSDTSLIK